MSLLRGRGRRSFPQKVSANLPLVCPHHGENAHKWSSETLPDVALDGKRVLKQRSGRVPDQQGRGARWHITASLCAAIPRMRHSGVGEFASDQQGEGCPDSIAKCCWRGGGDCGTGPLSQLCRAILCSSLKWANPENVSLKFPNKNNWMDRNDPLVGKKKCCRYSESNFGRHFPDTPEHWFVCVGAVPMSVHWFCADFKL